MKRALSLLGLALLSASLALPAQAETTLRITLQLPLKSHLGQNLLLFKDEVERESKGDLKVEIYDSAQLYPLTLPSASMRAMRESLEAMARGEHPSDRLLDFAELRRLVGFEDYDADSTRYAAPAERTPR